MRLGLALNPWLEAGGLPSVPPLVSRLLKTLPTELAGRALEGELVAPPAPEDRALPSGRLNAPLQPLAQAQPEGPQAHRPQRPLRHRLGLPPRVPERINMRTSRLSLGRRPSVGKALLETRQTPRPKLGASLRDARRAQRRHRLGLPPKRLAPLTSPQEGPLRGPQKRCG